MKYSFLLVVSILLMIFIIIFTILVIYSSKKDVDQDGLFLYSINERSFHFANYPNQSN